MPRRKTEDANETAFRIMRESTTRAGSAVEPVTKSDISRVMAELGRRGGKIGGKKRMTTLSQEQRSQIAYKAAQARWANREKS
jgi:hypothetical protein